MMEGSVWIDLDNEEMNDGFEMIILLMIDLGVIDAIEIGIIRVCKLNFG